jgi:hypothetical protein
MKKIFYILLAFFSLVLISCGTVVNTTTTETISTTETIARITLDKIEGSSTIPENNILLDTNKNENQPIRLSYINSTDNLIERNTTSIFNTSGETSEIPIYITTINSQEWLVIYLDQPAEIIDQYVIQSVTINYPNNTQRKWQNSSTEFSDPMSRKMSITPDGTKIYIPITTSDYLGDYIYTVEAVEYMYNQENYLAVKNTDTIDSVIMRVGVGIEITHDLLDCLSYNALLHTLVYDTESENYNNLYSNNLIYDEVYINGVLVGEHIPITNNFSIPEEVYNITDNWVTLEVRFNTGDNELSILKFFIKENDSRTVNIHNYEQFNMIPRETQLFMYIILFNDIIIPAEFEPLHINNLVISSNNNSKLIFLEENITFWEFTSEDYLNVKELLPDASEINISIYVEIDTISGVIFDNKSSMYGNFRTYYSPLNKYILYNFILKKEIID